MPPMLKIPLAISPVYSQPDPHSCPYRSPLRKQPPGALNAWALFSRMLYPEHGSRRNGKRSDNDEGYFPAMLAQPLPSRKSKECKIPQNDGRVLLPCRWVGLTLRLCSGLSGTGSGPSLSWSLSLRLRLRLWLSWCNAGRKSRVGLLLGLELLQLTGRRHGRRYGRRYGSGYWW